MFHWICPECGQESVPEVKECPICKHPPTGFSRPLSDSLTVALTPEVTPAGSVGERAATQKMAVPPKIILPRDVVFQPNAFLGSKRRVVLDAIPAATHSAINVHSLGLRTTPLELPDFVMDDFREPKTFANRLADLAGLLQEERVDYTVSRSFDRAVSGPRARPPRDRPPTIIDVTPDSPFSDLGDDKVADP